MKDDLIARLEAATADSAELLIDCYQALNGGRLFADPGDPTFGETYNCWRRFKHMLEAEAYESAALTLVPEGWGEFELSSIGGHWFCKLDTPLTYNTSKGTTPALAIVIAALRALEATVNEWAGV